MRSRLRLVTLLVTAAVALALTSGQAQQSANVESLALQDTAGPVPSQRSSRHSQPLHRRARSGRRWTSREPGDRSKADGRRPGGIRPCRGPSVRKALNGFSVELTEAEAVAISEDPRVAFIEEDSVMETQVTQTNPPWGLDRIGHTCLSTAPIRTRPRAPA